MPIFLRLFVKKVNCRRLLCALVGVFCWCIVKNLPCVAKTVALIVLECCEPYSGAEIFMGNLLNPRLD